MLEKIVLVEHRRIGIMLRRDVEVVEIGKIVLSALKGMRKENRSVVRFFQGVPDIFGGNIDIGEKRHVLEKPALEHRLVKMRFDRLIGVDGFPFPAVNGVGSLQKDRLGVEEVQLEVILDCKSKHAAQHNKHKPDGNHRPSFSMKRL